MGLVLNKFLDLCIFYTRHSMHFLHSRVHAIHFLHSVTAIGEEDSNVSKLVEMSEEGTSSLVPMETLSNHRHNGAMGEYISNTPPVPHAQEVGTEEDETLSTEDDS